MIHTAANGTRVSLALAWLRSPSLSLTVTLSRCEEEAFLVGWVWVEGLPVDHRLGQNSLLSRAKMILNSGVISEKTQRLEVIQGGLGIH